MEKSKKAELVSDIKQRLQSSEAVFVVAQNRITVADAEVLRKQLREVNSSYFVSKNTLAKIALKDTDFESILPFLSGQTAMVFSKDITGAAKVIFDYASKNEDKLKITCGGYSKRLLSSDDVKTLATLPSINELRAKIIAVIQTPAQRLATLSQAPASQLARVLKAYAEK